MMSSGTERRRLLDAIESAMVEYCRTEKFNVLNIYGDHYVVFVPADSDHVETTPGVAGRRAIVPDIRNIESSDMRLVSLSALAAAIADAV